MEIQGKVIKVLDVQKFTSSKNGNEYVKNTFVLETSGQYPKKIAFSVMGEDKFTQMGIVVGGQYNVSFDVESREWNSKWFTECNAWRATRVDGQQQQAQVQQTTQPAPTPQPQAKSAQQDDGLPF